MSDPLPEPARPCPGAALYLGDALRVLPTLPEGSVQTCCTSPPYFGLRDYGCAGQIGLESTPDEYVARLVEVFREVRRVLRDDGTLWLNLGDSYSTRGGVSCRAKGRAGFEENGRVRRGQPAGHAHKQLLGIPWRVAFALQADGWLLRSEIIWAKPNPMPESMRDRPTRSHEYLFLLAKQARYFYDTDAIAEHALQPSGKARLTGQHKRGALQPLNSSRLGTNQGCPMRNKRSVWTVTPKPFRGAHFAVMPPALVLPCVLAGTSGRGCCPACGAPWARQVKREKGFQARRVYEGGLRGRRTGAATDARYRGIGFTRENTTGWRPSCCCPAADPVPCTALDPFAGSGTVGLVALRRDRRFVGVELNPEYHVLALKRLAAVDGPLFASPAPAAGG